MCAEDWLATFVLMRGSYHLNSYSFLKASYVLGTGFLHGPADMPFTPHNNLEKRTIIVPILQLGILRHPGGHMC